MFESPLCLTALPQADLWFLTAPLSYRLPDGELIRVPHGFITDMASIPHALDWIPFLNRTGISRRAACLHDWAYSGLRWRGKGTGATTCCVPPWWPTAWRRPVRRCTSRPCSGLARQPGHSMASGTRSMSTRRTSRRPTSSTRPAGRRGSPPARCPTRTIMWPFRRRPKPPAIPPYRPAASEAKPAPKPAIEVEEADTRDMTATGIHRAWTAGQMKDPKPKG